MSEWYLPSHGVTESPSHAIQEIDQNSLDQINKTLEQIKLEISTSNFEQATESLRSLTLLLQELEI